MNELHHIQKWKCPTKWKKQFRNDCPPQHLEMSVSHQIKKSLEMTAPQHLEMSVSHQIKKQFRNDCAPQHLEMTVLHNI